MILNVYLECLEKYKREGICNNVSLWLVQFLEFSEIEFFLYTHTSCNFVGTCGVRKPVSKINYFRCITYKLTETFVWYRNLQFWEFSELNSWNSIQYNYI